MKFNIVMPMAGLGSRFNDSQYSLPKPLINIKGKPMYAWATESLPLEYCKKLIFILLKTQYHYDLLYNDIINRYKKFNPKILTVRKLTRGQSETVLEAKKLINNNEPLLIHNADTAFTINKSWIDTLKVQALDGALLVFKSTEDRWSFSRSNDKGEVEEVREKIPISNWASTGTYYFKSGMDFVRLAQANIDINLTDSGEFYIAPLYNEMIRSGKLVKNLEIEELFCFGTPKDLKDTLKKNNFHLLKNK